MKCTVIITDEREEIVVYAPSRTPLIRKIEELAEESRELFGTVDGETVRLSPEQIQLFTIRGGRLLAVTADREYTMRERLYMLEDELGDGFVKINQSCIANISAIAKFRPSVGGALCVVFKNGYTEYVSRRQLKAVKTAIGIK